MNPRLLIWGSIAFGVTTSIYSGAFSNFVVETFHVTATDFGLLAAARELPGLLSVLMFWVLGRFNPKVAFITAGLALALGTLATGLSPNLVAAGAAAFVVSIGTHLFGPQASQLVLDSATPGRQASHLSRLLSWGSGASMAGLALLSLIGHALPLRMILVGTTAFALIAAGQFLRRDPGNETRIAKPSGLIFYRSCAAYYALTVLSAMREMVVITFATFLLVGVFHASVAVMAFLLLVRQAVSVGLRPVLGRFMDSFGVHRTLAASYCILALVFAGYIAVHTPLLAYVLFVVDWSLTNVDNIALDVVAQASTPPGTTLQTLAMGDTLAHIGAVLMPVVGGLIWDAMGRAPVFATAGIMALMTAWIAFRGGRGVAGPGMGLQM